MLLLSFLWPEYLFEPLVHCCQVLLGQPQLILNKLKTVLPLLGHGLYIQGCASACAWAYVILDLMLNMP